MGQGTRALKAGLRARRTVRPASASGKAPDSRRRRRLVVGALGAVGAVGTIGTAGTAGTEGAAQAAAREAALAAPTRLSGAAPAGGFGETHETAGHRLRDEAPRIADQAGVEVRHCEVLVIGAGIAGLAAARALRLSGITDVRVIEMAAAAGGNSRASRIGGLPCPTGAHYLPLPGPQSPEIAAFLTEIGVRDASGRYDERMQIHAPQERLFIHGVWQDGLLPTVAQDARTFAQYRRFARVIDGWRSSGGFAMPAARARSDQGSAFDALRAQTFSRWLDDQGFDASGLRWYLDYCCRDEYGAGAAVVSAWAGLHYFASRHGFVLPPVLAGAEVQSDDRDTMLTWPEGNGWLVERLASPLGGRLLTGRMARRVVKHTDAAHWIVDLVATDNGRRLERWQAGCVIWAAPLFLAPRVIDAPGPRAAELAAVLRTLSHAPWIVANVLVDARWQPRGGELAWDNVIHDSTSLGYVDARHQRLDRLGGDALLTWYQALGGVPGARAALGSTPFATMAKAVVADLARAHPEIGSHVTRIEIHRWAHAMAMPTPAAMSGAAREARLALARGRDGLWFAHSELAGYSVFEEAFCAGDMAGRAAAALVGR